MNRAEQELLVLDERVELTLSELCELCDASAQYVFEWVNEGLLHPRGQGSSQWRFPASQVVRLRTARRLQRDLELEGSALPLVMDLLDEVRYLRRRVRILEHRFGD